MVFLVTGLCVTGCAKVVDTAAPARQRASTNDRLPLEVRLEADKPEYRVGDTIRFTVTISNPDNEPVTFFNDNKWVHLDRWPADESMYYGDRYDRRYKKPDGTEGHLVGRLSVGPISRNTYDATFTTLEPGGLLTRTVNEPAKVPGRWKARTWLRSGQNHLVTGHEPMGGSFFRTGDPVEDARRQKLAREAEEKHRRRMAEEGWTWDGQERFYYKTKAEVALGEARSNEITLIVREK